MRWGAKKYAFLLFFSIIHLTATFPVQVWAFYEWESDQGYLGLHGLVRALGTAYENPGGHSSSDAGSDSGLAFICRLFMEGQKGENINFELHAYQTYIPASLRSGQTGLGGPMEVERTALLEKSFSEDEYMHLAIDRLNLRWSHRRLDFIVGRQAINLATTLYFTPNDFFAPFSAQTFYRVYKPGVDAARVEVRLGDLSQLSLISVLGYKYDLSSGSGWSNRPERRRISSIGRISTVFRDTEVALLGGFISDAKVIGYALQGELFEWLGIRAEGHVANPDGAQRHTYSEWSVGVEHHWANSLDLRLEQFYHGSGAGSVSKYDVAPDMSRVKSYYLGRNYSALGIGYEFTPLLNAQMLAIANLTDHSYLLSGNAIYSLSDEAELSVNLGLPIGQDPEGNDIKSEFGLYPYWINIEIRYYF